MDCTAGATRTMERRAAPRAIKELATGCFRRVCTVPLNNSVVTRRPGGFQLHGLSAPAHVLDLCQQEARRALRGHRRRLRVECVASST